MKYFLERIFYRVERVLVQFLIILLFALFTHNCCNSYFITRMMCSSPQNSIEIFRNRAIHFFLARIHS